MTPAQFQDMIAQLRRGNNRPLKVLFERYADYCVAGLQRHTGCQQEDAEDIFQDAILQFRENALENRIKSTKNLKNYLYSICFNLHRARTQQQAQRNGQLYEVAQQLYPARYAPPALEQAEEEQQQQTLRQVTFAAFMQLSERCQQLLTYCYLDELDHKTIAERMGFANTDVVKSNKSRCLRRWMQHINKMKHDRRGLPTD